MAFNLYLFPILASADFLTIPVIQSFGH